VPPLPLLPPEPLLPVAGGLLLAVGLDELLLLVLPQPTQNETAISKQNKAANAYDTFRDAGCDINKALQ
jgi:hypothetical protein